MCSKRETIHNSEQQCINPCISTVFIGPRCPWGPIYGSGFLKLSEPPFADLTDVTLADEDTNSILTDNANRAIQGNVGNVVMQVAPPGPGGQTCN